MRFRKIINFLHLWLGLISGLIVFVLCVTACLLVFEKEIRDFTEPYQFVRARHQPFIKPSQIRAIVAEQFRKEVSNIVYNAPGRSLTATLKSGKKRSRATVLYIDPYTGKVLKITNPDKDFFKFILTGHYYLWLPTKIGKVIVPVATLVFVFLLVSGMIIWYPKKRSQIKRSFTIKWKAKWKRLNYDLHNVLGFYAFLILLIFSLTGLVFGFKWFAGTVYWSTSGGKTVKMSHKPQSAIEDGKSVKIILAEDQLFERHIIKFISAHNHVATLYFPERSKGSFMIYFNPDRTTRYLRETKYFDQYTLKPLEAAGTGFDAGLYKKAGFGDRLKRMNYDLHLGAILGLPTKILAFLVCILGASLPLTGFYIWLGKQRKKTLLKRPNQLLTVIPT